MRHQMNRGSFVVRGGGKGEKRNAKKNVVKSCKYIIHLCQKKGWGENKEKKGCVDVVCLVLFL